MTSEGGSAEGSILQATSQSDSLCDFSAASDLVAVETINLEALNPFTNDPPIKIEESEGEGCHGRRRVST
jgi:hypothetical protein